MSSWLINQGQDKEREETEKARRENCEGEAAAAWFALVTCVHLFDVTLYFSRAVLLQLYSRLANPIWRQF
jgi:hypothetical protein